MVVIASHHMRVGVTMFDAVIDSHHMRAGVTMFGVHDCVRITRAHSLGHAFAQKLLNVTFRISLVVHYMFACRTTAMVTKTTPDVGTFAVRGPVHKPRRKITLSSLIIFFGNLPLRISEAWGHCDSFIRNCATWPVNTETTTDVSQKDHGSRRKITLCSLMRIISNLHLHLPFRW